MTGLKDPAEAEATKLADNAGCWTAVARNNGGVSCGIELFAIGIGNRERDILCAKPCSRLLAFVDEIGHALLSTYNYTYDPNHHTPSRL